MKVDLTGNGLMQALRQQIEKSVNYLYSPGGTEENRRKPEVFENVLPRKTRGRANEAEHYPHVLLQYVGEEIKETERGAQNIATIYVIAGIAEDEDNKYAIHEVINCLTRIRNDLLKIGFIPEFKDPHTLGVFELVRKGLQLVIPQEQADPKFYGYLKLEFILPMITQEQGAFLHGRLEQKHE